MNLRLDDFLKFDYYDLDDWMNRHVGSFHHLDALLFDLFDNLSPISNDLPQPNENLLSYERWENEYKDESIIFLPWLLAVEPPPPLEGFEFWCVNEPPELKAPLRGPSAPWPPENPLKLISPIPGCGISGDDLVKTFFWFNINSISRHPFGINKSSHFVILPDVSTIFSCLSSAVDLYKWNVKKY